MPKNLIIRYSNKIISGWIVMLIDVVLLIISIFLANLFRFDFVLAELETYHIFYQLMIVSIFGGASLLITGSHRGIIRHTGQQDGIRIFKAVTLTVILIAIINYIFLVVGMKNKEIEQIWISNLRVIPNSVLLIFYPIALFFLLVFRMAIKLAYYSITSQDTGDKINVLVYGAGKAGIGVRNTLSGDQFSTYNVVGFIDDHPGKIGKSVQGTDIFSSAVISNDFLTKRKIREIIIAMPSLAEEKKLEIYKRLIDLDVNIKNVPPFEAWINGKLTLNQIQNLKIEDLLQREPIRLGNDSVLPTIKGKTVMVTGAAGSIGSELSRQLLHFKPHKLVFIDQAESSMFALEQELSALQVELELRGQHQKINMAFIIADVSIDQRMRSIMKSMKPHLIFHAAAYKHVPLMESNPMEAVRVNIFGTCNLANAAFENDVEKFIMISTDKAVNPTSVMGATKRIAEIYIQSLNSKPGNKTAFITTRFGNVLGSNGSVTETFKKQILTGGPITVTHPDITRYFMTIPEACQLVLEAGAMGNGREIFIFDMGSPVKIVELAKNMIRLSGNIPGKDVMISFTGLRPGEKLYEELLNDKELTQPTHHPKIMIAKVRDYSFDEVTSMIADLNDLYKFGDNRQVVRKMKKVIPEYISNNSLFSSLDHEESTIN